MVRCAASVLVPLLGSGRLCLCQTRCHGRAWCLTSCPTAMVGRALLVLGPPPWSGVQCLCSASAMVGLAVQVVAPPPWLGLLCWCLLYVGGDRRLLLPPPPSLLFCFAGVVALPIVFPCPVSAFLLLRTCWLLVRSCRRVLLHPRPPMVCLLGMSSPRCSPSLVRSILFFSARLLAVCRRLSPPVFDLDPTVPSFVFRRCRRPAARLPLSFLCFLFSAGALAGCRLLSPAAAPPPPFRLCFAGIVALPIVFSCSLAAFLFLLACAPFVGGCRPLLLPPPLPWMVFRGCHRSAAHFSLSSRCFRVSARILAVRRRLLPLAVAPQSPPPWFVYRGCRCPAVCSPLSFLCSFFCALVGRLSAVVAACCPPPTLGCVSRVSSPCPSISLVLPVQSSFCAPVGRLSAPLAPCGCPSPLLYVSRVLSASCSFFLVLSLHSCFCAPVGRSSAAVAAC